MMARRSTPLALTALLLLASSGCELVADFDRDKLVPSRPDAALSDGAVGDAASDEDAGADAAEPDEDAGD